MDQFEPALKICRFSWMLLLNFFNIFLGFLTHEHEKYPNCVRLCTVVSVIDDLFVIVYRNTLYHIFGHLLCTISLHFFKVT